MLRYWFRNHSFRERTNLGPVVRVNRLVPPRHPVDVLICNAGDVVEHPPVDALRQEPMKLIAEALLEL